MSFSPILVDSFVGALKGGGCLPKFYVGVFPLEAEARLGDIDDIDNGDTGHSEWRGHRPVELMLT